MFDELAAHRDELVARRDELVAHHDELTEKLRKRDEAIAYLRRLLYGRSTEKLTAEELGQLLLAYGATLEEAMAQEPVVPVPEQVDAEPEEEPPQPPKKKRKHPGRTKISPTVERVVTETRVPEAERCCTTCKQEMTFLGWVEHECVQYEPPKLRNHVERREVLVCKTLGCKCDATTADRAQPPTVRTRAAASLLAMLIESKCDDALPIHRQCDQLARLGFTVPVETMYGWWRYATALLLPVCDALLGSILDDPWYVGLDDTGIDVLDRKSKGGKYRGHFWCFRGSRRRVAFMFTRTWEAEEIAPWIRAIAPHAFIQVDDYGGYSSMIEDADGKKKELVPAERRLGCMMHVRRRFHAAWKLGDKRAAVPLELIRKIYEVEKTAKGLSVEQRLALRLEHSLPLLDQLDAWVDAHDGTLGRTGKLAEAVRYAKQQRAFIRRCFTDGRFEIDNGCVERAIREPAIGRKNFLFTGSEAAARRLAGAYSLVMTCRLLGISTRDYLIDVIEKLEGRWPMRQLSELLPHNWAARRGLVVDSS
jgi:transposase